MRDAVAISQVIFLISRDTCQERIHHIAESPRRLRLSRDASIANDLRQVIAATKIYKPNAVLGQPDIRVPQVSVRDQPALLYVVQGICKAAKQSS